MLKNFPEKILILTLFLALAFGAYLPTLSSPFMQDDDILITDNKKYFSEGLLPLLRYQFTASHQQIPERPVTVLSLWLNYKISGIKPSGFKAGDILLHALAAFAAFLLFQLLWKLHSETQIPSPFPLPPGERESLSFPLSLWERVGVRGSDAQKVPSTFFPLAASLFYLLHPIHTMAVNCVVQRGVILAALFGFLSFYFFLRFHHEDSKKRFYVLTFFCLLLSVLSKPGGIAFGPILLLYLLIFSKPEERWRNILTWIPVLLLFAIPVFTHLKGLQTQTSPLESLNYFLIQTRVLFIYFKLFFIPLPLKFRYDTSLDPSLLHNLTWLAILGHLLILSLAAYALRFPKGKILGFGILGAYLALAPESSFFPITWAVFEYRTYGAFFFLILGFCSFFQGFFQKRSVALALCLIVPLLFGFLTFQRNNQINTIEKWHFDMVKGYQKSDPMNLVTLDLLGRNSEKDKAAGLLILLEKKRSDNPIYGFLKSLIVDSLSKPLKENLAMIESSRKIITNQKFQVIPLFLEAADSLIKKAYPEDQKDFIRHAVFFNQVFYLLKMRRTSIDLVMRYQQVLQRLKKYYDSKPALTPSEEWEKEKVLAAIYILSPPKGLTYSQFFKKMLDEHPNWIAFFDQDQ
ncbi:MAG: hypothetical protein EXS63_06580 [Candidatus Omnitrophica bacterium]|nr:hypothetical protein [Candidatus Omnitrophota bacterium]